MKKIQNLDIVTAVGFLINKQHSLNKLMNGNEYLKLKKSTKTGKALEFGIALGNESNELIDSTPWKHWNGKTEADFVNVVLETIDILHFLPSILLELSDGEEIEVFDPHYGEDIEVDVESTYKHMLNTHGGLLRPSEMDSIEEDKKKLLEIKHLYTRCNLISAYHALETCELTYPLSSFSRKHIRVETIKTILYCFYMLEVNFDYKPLDVIKLYLAKNALNQFRMENGYGNNTYLKMWPLKEDNVFTGLEEIVKFEDNVVLLRELVNVALEDDFSTGDNFIDNIKILLSGYYKEALENHGKTL